MNLDHYLTTYTKINSKWIKDLSIRPKTLKLLEENTDSKLLDFSLGYDFWDLTPKAKATKAKNKCNYIKLKLLHSKETNKLKRQPTEWEKIFANHISDKGLVSKIYTRTHTIQQQKN